MAPPKADEANAEEEFPGLGDFSETAQQVGKEADADGVEAQAEPQSPEANLQNMGAGELDDEMKRIVEELRLQKLKDAQKGKKPEEEEEESEPKKVISDMTSEEKMEWLEMRRQAVRQKRAREKAERAKASEKSRREVNRAAADLKERIEESQTAAFVHNRKREEQERKRARSASIV